MAARLAFTHKEGPLGYTLPDAVTCSMGSERVAKHTSGTWEAGNPRRAQRAMLCETHLMLRRHLQLLVAALDEACQTWACYWLTISELLRCVNGRLSGDGSWLRQRSTDVLWHIWARLEARTRGQTSHGEPKGVAKCQLVQSCSIDASCYPYGKSR